jgi:hypothetical protein
MTISSERRVARRGTADASFGTRGGGAARAPFGVIGGDAARGLEPSVGDDPGRVDGDPFVPTPASPRDALRRRPAPAGTHNRRPAPPPADPRAAFRSRPAPPLPAARTTGPSPPAHPLDGAPVQPDPEPVGHLLGDLGPRPGVGVDKVHDLGPQLHWATTAAPLVE